MAHKRVARSLGIVVLAGGLVATAAVLEAGRASPPPPRAEKVPPPPPVIAAAVAPIVAPPAPAPEPSCGVEAAGAPEVGDPAARKAAQRGLDFLAREAVAWQQANNCYGCHVQAVTVEAFAIGYKHQYRIGKGAFDTVLGGMMNLNGGSRRPGGLGHSSPDIAATAKVLGAVAFAKYDQHVGEKVRRDLLAEGKRLLRRQGQSGAVTLPFSSPPVALGTVQGTALAMITWKRIYEITADEAWLGAIQRGESYLSGQVTRWKGKAPDLQSLDFAIMGLVAAGVGTQEDLLVGLANQVRERQRDDGGWALSRGEASSPFATGQALYTLRLLGMSDRDAVIARGTKWLVRHQQRGGGWSAAGFGKAEAMWAVLGLVSIDVLSISVSGLEDGQLVEGTATMAIGARDNNGGGVVKVELDVDDRRVASACGAELAYQLVGAGLAAGRHVLDVRATNARGEVSRRRLEVFTGDTFIVQVASRWVSGGTEVSLRNLSRSANTVAVEIVPAEGGSPVFTKELPGQQGSMNVRFAGAKAGKYVARLSYKDASGAVRQREELPFVHDTTEKQWASYGQIQGAVALPGGGKAANAEVVLVDDKGKEVARTRSTAAGQYRFKNVDADKKYQIRVEKDGFESAPVMAAPARAAEVQADTQLQAK